MQSITLLGRYIINRTFEILNDRYEPRLGHASISYSELKMIIGKELKNNSFAMHQYRHNEKLKEDKRFQGQRHKHRWNAVMDYYLNQQNCARLLSFTTPYIPWTDQILLFDNQRNIYLSLSPNDTMVDMAQRINMTSQEKHVKVR